MINLTLKTAMTVYLLVSRNLSSKYPNTEIILHAKKSKLFKITLWKNKIFPVKKE